MSKVKCVRCKEFFAASSTYNHLCRSCIIDLLAEGGYEKVAQYAVDDWRDVDPRDFEVCAGCGSLPALGFESAFTDKDKETLDAMGIELEGK